MAAGAGVVVGVALLLPWRKGSMPKLTPSQSNISVNIEGANALVKSRVVPIVEKVVPLLRSLRAGRTGAHPPGEERLMRSARIDYSNYEPGTGMVCGSGSAPAARAAASPPRRWSPPCTPRWSYRGTIPATRALD